MSRQTFDWRLVTHCDACYGPIDGSRFVGSHGLTELLGLGFCPACADEQGVDFTAALLRSGLLSEKGEAAVKDWMDLQVPPDIRDLVATLRHDRPVYPQARFREN